MFSTAETVSPLTKTLLGAFPHSAMIINRDRQILSANSHAIEAGAEVGGICWQTFGHAACLSDEHKMLSQENSSAAGISCTFCRADQCLDNHCQENDPAVQVFGKTLDTYWVAINSDLYLHYAIDVTEHEGTKALLRCVIDSAEDLIYFKDRNSTYIGCNKTSEKFTGIEEREQIGKTDYDFFDPEMAEKIVKDDQKVIENHTPERTEEWVSSPAFGKVLLDTVKAPIYGSDGYLLGLVGISRDITERRRDEDAIKAAHKLLEIKNQEMEQFVYIVSHDLKSPLVTVKSFIVMLRQDLLNADQQRINEDLNYIDSAADKMQQLLDALLQYSRICRIDTLAQTMSVDQQVQNCLTTLAGILQQHQVQVSTSELPYQLHGNSLHFGQIWQNLIENAVKYRGDQPQPHIEIGATQQGHDVVFYVRDNGMGLAPEHRERIFNLFSQLNPGSDGSGLGLALVKKIVSIYQGRIWVESEGKGKGSCFYFALPGALVKDNTAT